MLACFALARAVDHAAHHRDRHVFHAFEGFAPFRHAMADVTLDRLREFLEIGAGGAAAARARHHHRDERTQAHGLQDFLRHDHFVGAIAVGFGRERYADGVADAFLQQHRHAGGGGDDALAAHAGFGEAEVQRVVAALARGGGR